MVTGTPAPYLRTPTTPIACKPLLVTIAPARAGRSWLWRIGSSNDFKSSGEDVPCRPKLAVAVNRTSNKILKIFIGANKVQKYFHKCCRSHYLTIPTMLRLRDWFRFSDDPMPIGSPIPRIVIPTGVPPSQAGDSEGPRVSSQSAKCGLLICDLPCSLFRSRRAGVPDTPDVGVARWKSGRGIPTIFHAPQHPSVSSSPAPRC